ncbi:MAG TPA: tRNA (adenosine(37)-N6)-threonylcarbamoyltransferase complex dimerization subunit type 1 TsaB, partial [Nitrospiraceae bacterium]|nr:tRNA (adenosine(37)-N6)-threonylcarbamoyltransferase complex dimerization subunit type 1 TsaB [Nitrospiraceae bacterium]
HAKWLVPTIDRVLASGGLTLSDLDGLAVSIGPGSFTGLRVGLATMLGLRVVTGLPLAAVPTLEAMAWNLRSADLPLCPILRCRRGEVYWALYQWTSAGALRCITAERVGPLELLAQSINGPTLVFGEGWQTYRDDIRRLLGARACEAPPEAMAASAVSVGLAGLERLARGEVAGQGLSPRYVQRAEAELSGCGRAGTRPAGAGGAPSHSNRMRSAGPPKVGQGSRSCNRREAVIL